MSWIIRIRCGRGEKGDQAGLHWYCYDWVLALAIQVRSAIDHPIDHGLQDILYQQGGPYTYLEREHLVRPTEAPVPRRFAIRLYARWQAAKDRQAVDQARRKSHEGRVNSCILNKGHTLQLQFLYI